MRYVHTQRSSYSLVPLLDCFWIRFPLSFEISLKFIFFLLKSEMILETSLQLFIMCNGSWVLHVPITK